MAETTRGPGAPSDAVRSAFQVGYSTPVPLGDAWGDGWRCDHVVLTPSTEPSRATWSAQVIDRMRPTGVAVPRPLRSTDGRYSVGGWTARSFFSGHRAPRFDEIAAAALSVNRALAGERRPAFLTAGRATADGEWRDAELFAAAEAAAWAEDPTELLAPVMDPDAVPRPDVAAAMAKAARLIPLRSAVTAPDQLVHGDMLGCTVFDGHADPVVVDLVPAWRPAAWSVALLVVDAVAWASAEDELIDRWSHLPEFNQLLLRAVLYRLFVHAVLPDSVPNALPGIERVSDIVAVRIAGRSARDDIIGDGDLAAGTPGVVGAGDGDDAQETGNSLDGHESSSGHDHGHRS